MNIEEADRGGNPFEGPSVVPVKPEEPVHFVENRRPK
jgi:hypothetical protein